ncbi:hypothetical protein PIB30_012778 [Stylosanthes scabra]|uniref:Uncharacterized protein n=1 Tax=Stylosanthes scabra TaxID=79078 RepID=A0ABU6S5U4_9FABA|nr:hypothetical protein [Stylosanthes scabra]
MSTVHNREEHTHTAAETISLCTRRRRSRDYKVVRKMTEAMMSRRRRWKAVQWRSWVKPEMKSTALEGSDADRRLQKRRSRWRRWKAVQRRSWVELEMKTTAFRSCRLAIMVLYNGDNGRRGQREGEDNSGFEASLSLSLNLLNRGTNSGFMRISATCSVVGIWVTAICP